MGPTRSSRPHPHPRLSTERERGDEASRLGFPGCRRFASPPLPSLPLPSPHRHALRLVVLRLLFQLMSPLLLSHLRAAAASSAEPHPPPHSGLALAPVEVEPCRTMDAAKDELGTHASRTVDRAASPAEEEPPMVLANASSFGQPSCEIKVKVIQRLQFTNLFKDLLLQHLDLYLAFAFYFNDLIAVNKFFNCCNISI